MADAKAIERTYTIPLRKEYMKVPRWKRTRKAVFALRQFLSKHMKSDDVKLGSLLNNHMWKHGGKNPPHHVKVNVKKDEKGIVNAELFGAPKEAPKEEVKNTSKKAPKATKE
jgi:large subunit ribosomal protein L31e